MQRKEPIRIPTFERKRWSVEAIVDQRTLQRFLAGLPIQSMSETRIRTAYHKLRDNGWPFEVPALEQ